MLKWWMSLPEEIRNDIEVDIYVPMPPKESYTVTARITSVKKGKPYIPWKDNYEETNESDE